MKFVEDRSIHLVYNMAIYALIICTKAEKYNISSENKKERNVKMVKFSA